MSDPVDPLDQTVVGETVIAVPGENPTEHTVMVPRPGDVTVVADHAAAARSPMNDPVVVERTASEARPRYRARKMPDAAPPPLEIIGVEAARGQATHMPSVAAASRRGARISLAVWIVVTAASIAGVVLLSRLLLGS